MALHIRLIAVLLVLNGLACLAMAAVLLVGPLLDSVEWLPSPEDAGQPSVSPWPALILFGFLSMTMLSIGSLQIAAGLRTFWFRGYWLGIAGLCSCLLSILSCYCIVTSWPLMLYGLLIYLQPSSRRIFAFRSAGWTTDQLLGATPTTRTVPR